MVMCDYKFEMKENNFKTKDKIESKHVYLIQLSLL